MPKWVKSFLTKMVLRFVLKMLKDYLSEEEHASITKTVKTKVNISS